MSRVETCKPCIILGEREPFEYEKKSQTHTHTRFADMPQRELKIEWWKRMMGSKWITFWCWRFDSSQTQLNSNSKSLSFASSCIPYILVCNNYNYKDYQTILCEYMMSRQSRETIKYKQKHGDTTTFHRMPQDNKVQTTVLWHFYSCSNYDSILLNVETRMP